ncbi:hypothetical protein COV18_07390 [Candidatus Woesearchaeota archaeon CG10_big_fil_rev_8_21_14_0_10_37_12]|nr:MAG: hypothetical protein COV18_07390 [Candidatus Woesearchaeota archaeon CG10_big_fil_rev_8_21_14_0_10_37_12]
MITCLADKRTSGPVHIGEIVRSIVAEYAERTNLQARLPCVPIASQGAKSALDRGCARLVLFGDAVYVQPKVGTGYAREVQNSATDGRTRLGRQVKYIQ